MIYYKLYHFIVLISIVKIFNFIKQKSAYIKTVRLENNRTVFDYLNIISLLAGPFEIILMGTSSSFSINSI